MAEQCQRILRAEYTEELDELYHLGGTSGGARPKIMTEIDGEEWIIKFPAKNFTFIYKEAEDEWRLSPAYDLTYSTTYYGEHTTTVDGEGANPGRKELLQVGIKAGIRKAKCTMIINEVEELVREELSEYVL